MSVQSMIASHPHVRGNTNDALILAVEECISCAEICVVCADACLGEAMVAELTQCIRLDLDCADACAATARIGARRTGSNEAVIKLMLQACAEACRICGDECARHAGRHAHCATCAEACRRCEAACTAAAGTITPQMH